MKYKHTQVVDLTNPYANKTISGSTQKRMSLDLNKLANKLDGALSNETSETLTKFLRDKRMTNNKKSSVVQTAIEQIYQRILDSKNPNTLTKRGGDYRIGLQEAINILENLKSMHKEEIIQAAYSNMNAVEEDPMDEAENYYAEKFGGTMTNNKQTEVDIIELCYKQYPFSNNETRNAFITGYNKGKEMESHRLTERFEEGREIGQIEILAQQSTSNASSYADGYKEGYKRALKLVQLKVDKTIKVLKG